MVGGDNVGDRGRLHLSVVFQDVSPEDRRALQPCDRRFHCSVDLGFSIRRTSDHGSRLGRDDQRLYSSDWFGPNFVGVKKKKRCRRISTSFVAADRRMAGRFGDGSFQYSNFGRFLRIIPNYALEKAR